VNNDPQQAGNSYCPIFDHCAVLTRQVIDIYSKRKDKIIGANYYVTANHFVEQIKLLNPRKQKKTAENTCTVRLVLNANQIMHVKGKKHIFIQLMAKTNLH
jgi:cyanophycinase-like exopeptidase